MSRRGLERLEPQRKEEMKVIKDRLMWEDALKAHSGMNRPKLEIIDGAHQFYNLSQDPTPAYLP